MRPLRIAMIGQRGVPATFGGIEHHVEELGARMAQEGHRVTVYCRTNYVQGRPREHRGMTLRHVGTIGTKHLDAIVHSALSSIAAVAEHHDIVHYHALGPGLVAFLPRYASGAKVVLTVHGLDDERAKWGKGARTVLRTAGWLSARVPDATVVVSQALAEHYAAVHRRATTHISNGVVPAKPMPADRIRTELGLEPGSYVLFVGRLVPEKAPDLLMRAFRELPDGYRLVIAGGSSFSNSYTRSLADQAAADDRILLAGYVYGGLLRELYTNAAAFVLPSFLEGLPLTLLEAASYGIPVVASDIEPHREVMGLSRPGRELFVRGDQEALAAALQRTLVQGRAAFAGAEDLRRSVVDRYDWDVAAGQTLALYADLLGRPHEASRSSERASSPPVHAESLLAARARSGKAG